MIPFTKRTVLLKLLLIKRTCNALMKIYVPTLECKSDPFPSEPRKHCQKTPSQNILCSLKLPSGPPQIHFTANPAGLLYVFLSYISPKGILPWAQLKAFLMSFYDTTLGHLWLRELKKEEKRKDCENRRAESRETQWTEEVQKQNQIERR